MTRLIEILINPHNAWLTTALVQVGVLVVAVIIGYVAGWKDQKRVQERQRDEECASALRRPKREHIGG